MSQSLSELGVTPEVSSIMASLGEAPVDDDKVEETPEPSVEAQQVEAAEEAKEVTDEVVPKTPREEWLEDLEDMRLSPEDAAAILDKVMSTGHYSETYKMGGVQFRLRTRTTVDADRTVELLQEMRPEAAGVYAHVVARINLASSLVKYADKAFPHTAPSEDNRKALNGEWRDRYNFCAALPAPAYYALSQVLQRFDTKVSLACDARSLENF
jgi:hypothetical protein